MVERTVLSGDPRLYLSSISLVDFEWEGLTDERQLPRTLSPFLGAAVHLSSGALL